MFMMEKPNAATAGGLECIGGVVRLIALVECLSIDHDRYIVLECNDWGNVTCIEPKLDTCQWMEANIWCPKCFCHDQIECNNKRFLIWQQMSRATHYWLRLVVDGLVQCCQSHG